VNSPHCTQAGSAPAPERFATSSAEFERGLLATMVARRASVLDDPADRELLWFIHYLSHQKGGLKALVDVLLCKFSARIRTAGMLRIGKRSGQHYSPDEVRRIRREMPADDALDFRLRGEVRERGRWVQVQDSSREAVRKMNDELATLGCGRIGGAGAQDAELAKQPATYGVEQFLEACRAAALRETDGLEDSLSKLCLDPGTEIADGQPWYFPRLVSTLREYQEQWIAENSSGVVITEIGRKVRETLDYTLQSCSLTLVEGDSRTGKTFAARHWTDQHPGRARFVEVPPGNDDTGFFRALARGLGLGSLVNNKAVDIRERVESVLLTGDILLCLDEGHRLWPQVNIRFGFPKRIEWLMSMVNQGVPTCVVATPQFIGALKASDQKSGWNSAQLQGRLGHRESLPKELSIEDLIAVARSCLPEADALSLRALAAYARKSARCLAAIEAISKRARYVAGVAGRDAASTEDIRRAMRESVIPSDSKLVLALEPARAGKPRTNAPAATPQNNGDPPAGRGPALTIPDRNTPPSAPPTRNSQPQPFIQA
jgi:hypothetical protein